MCNRLHLIKICLCCFVNMYLFSSNLSTIAMISSSILSELFLVCLSCSNTFDLSHSSLGSDDKNIVFWDDDLPGTETFVLGD